MIVHLSFRKGSSVIHQITTLFEYSVTVVLREGRKGEHRTDKLAKYLEKNVSLYLPFKQFEGITLEVFRN